MQGWFVGRLECDTLLLRRHFHGAEKAKAAGGGCDGPGGRRSSVKRSSRSPRFSEDVQTAVRTIENVKEGSSF